MPFVPYGVLCGQDVQEQTAGRTVADCERFFPRGFLPQSVERFLKSHLRSVEDLHLLLALAAEPNRWWDELTVARELLISQREARSRLEHLAAHNLLEIRVTGEVRYQYRPGTSELRDGARACFDAYRADPMSVWRQLSKSATGGARDFSNAFRLRGGDDDDR